MSTEPKSFTPLIKLTKDMLKAMGDKRPGGVTDSEARFLVDLYYTIQKFRVRVNNQVKGLDRDAAKEAAKKGEDIVAEPHEFLTFTLGQFANMEANIKMFLDVYRSEHDMNWFFEQTVGIGPVIAAGLLAHIDIHKAITAGAVWRFAGLEPTVRWCGPAEAATIWKEASGSTHEEKLADVAGKIGRRPENLIHMATTKPDGSTVKLTAKNAQAAIARKPWNGALKTLCWKAGDSFKKFSGREDCYYGQIYRQRKELEVARNERGDFAEQAARILATKRFGDNLSRKAYEAGKLPAGHLDMRAMRYAEKLMLSHLWECWRKKAGLPITKPWVLGQPGHTHYLAPPQIDPGI